jgi:hypothetical protein
MIHENLELFSYTTGSDPCNEIKWFSTAFYTQHPTLFAPSYAVTGTLWRLAVGLLRQLQHPGHNSHGLLHQLQGHGKDLNCDFQLRTAEKLPQFDLQLFSGMETGKRICV